MDKLLELKPCPHCGSGAEILHIRSFNSFEVLCTGPETCRGKQRLRDRCNNRAAVVQQWNTRVSSDQEVSGG